MSLFWAGFLGCASYQPSDTDFQFHERFETGEAHAQTACEACHVLAAYDQRVRQGLDVPPPEDGEFVVEISGRREHCHPFVATLGEIPAPEACLAPDVPASLAAHEYCRFHAFHRSPPATCDGCHQVGHTAFDQGGG